MKFTFANPHTLRYLFEIAFHHISRWYEASTVTQDHIVVIERRELI